MLSTTFPPLPDMMAHASSADAPFDSEVSTADLDSEAFVTAPSATLHTPSSPTTAGQAMASEAMQLDILTQLLDSTTTTSTSDNCVTDSAAAATVSTLLSDPSVIAMTTTSSSAWMATSPSISPLALKLESSPLLSNNPGPSSSSSSSTTTKTHRKTSSTSRKRAQADPSEKEAKALQRVLRNRAAAQESRDKKRKYVSEIEASNEQLQHENTQLLKRLKTVESDNVALSQRLEALTAQFAQMQQLLSQTVKHNQPGAGFCQSAVLAKKDKGPFRLDHLTNSQQQKLAPPPKSHCTRISKKQSLNKHRQVYSMTMKKWMDKRNQSKEARLLDQNAAQTWMEISCRSFCQRKRALTLSSSAAASSLATCPIQQLVLTMVFLTSVLPQLMLNCSILFLISTGVRSSNPQEEQQLQGMVLSCILRQQQQLFLSRLSNGHVSFPAPVADTSARTIQDKHYQFKPIGGWRKS
ncbi:hypothetical protein BGX31_001550 [Mortierella sp. GBA43]|nr:hypothetical protein BGX31_001550 [Mortierella sp. GBA43]